MRAVRFQRGFSKDNVSKLAFSKDSVPFLRFDFLTEKLKPEQQGLGFNEGE